jgi:hypothetical protein
MSDWEIVGNGAIAQSSPAQSGSDWEIVNNAPSSNQQMPGQESIGKSLIYAIPRIGEDIAKGAYQFAKNIPNYYGSAKTEIPGLINVSYQHPLHTLSQAVAGSQEAINQLAQLPLNISQYGQQRLGLVPQGVVNAISAITPQDTTQAINQLFGKPQYPGETLVRGIARNIPTIAGATSIIKPLLSSTKNAIKNTIIDTHDALENEAAQGFKTVSDEVNKRGISQVSINNQLLQGLSDYFPKTKQSAQLINDANTGDYNALRKIQSQLYTKGKQNLGSSLETDRMRGAEMFEKRDDINQAISDHLQNTGNNDLVGILNKARNDYRTLQNIYYNPNMNNAIVNMVNKNYRKIPNNLTNVLQEQSVPMQALRDFHPGLENALSKYQMQQNISSKIKKYALPVALGAVGAAGYEGAKHGLSNHQ